MEPHQKQLSPNLTDPLHFNSRMKPKSKCANCNGNHSSNYRGFQAYRDLEKAFNKPKVSAVQRLQNQYRHQEPAKKPQPLGRTFAESVKNKPGGSNPQPARPQKELEPKPPQVKTKEPGLADVTKAIQKITQEMSLISSRLTKLEQAKTNPSTAQSRDQRKVKQNG